MTEFVHVHACVKKTTVVVVKATVEEDRHGSLMFTITAHDPKCKAAR